MEYSKAFVFSEVEKDDGLYFQWYELCQEEEDQIVPMPDLIPEHKHWELLAYD